MNIKVNIDVTPEEMRRLMGLPDVQEFNQQVMQKMVEKMTAGAEGYDPLGFFQASLMSNAELAKKWMDTLNIFSNVGKTN